MIEIAPHPLLAVGAFHVRLDAPLSSTPSPDWLTDLLRIDAEAPFERDDDRRKAVRDLLRHGGYKPTGRGKPSSEYLVRAATEGELPSINPLVDACNAVSLHSGLPLSVVDADLVRPPLSIAIAEPGTRYVFNRSGQEIDVSGLLCLFDAEGPCANAVKDSQRTKTHEDTRQAVGLVWGLADEAQRTADVTAWYRELCDRLGWASEPA